MRRMGMTRLVPADALRPRWSSASALTYLGAFVVLAATSALLGILAGDHGDWALIGYSALAAAIALGLALMLAQSGRAVAAGVFATVAVVLFGVFVGAVESELGILDSSDEWQPGQVLLELSIIAAALVALWRFRAPLLVLPIAVVLPWAVLGLGGEEYVVIASGIVLVALGIALDRAGREPYAMWLHLVGGLSIGGGVLTLVDSDLGWAFVGLLSLAYVAAAYLLGRASYAVLGAIGILATTTYFTLEGFSLLGAFLPFGSGEIEEGLDPWQVALSFVAVGLLIAALGFAENRVNALRRR